jgi:LuxR family maltose regulon positive regulatory protein
MVALPKPAKTNPYAIEPGRLRCEAWHRPSRSRLVPLPESYARYQLKIEAPRQPSTTVDRPRLLERASSTEQARLVLLIAPAGFGKTTLLTQWRTAAIEAGQAAAWLTLDDGDADARQFLAVAIRAVHAAGVEMDALLAQADSGLIELTVEGAARSMAAAIAKAGRRVTLMLDDYHRAGGPAVDQLVARLVALLPDNCTIVLSSRARPDLNLPQLLASGVATEIQGDALRFTPGESRDLLALDLTEEELKALVAHTEGWPIALQLVRLVLIQGQNVPGSLNRLTSRGGHLWSFLNEQVLGGLPAEAVEFLADTSILDRFNVEIADAVRERDDSWRLMEQLGSLQFFLTPLDDDNVWFRYHHLFAEYLQSLLRQRHPGRILELHSRASRAFERLGMLGDAVKHAGQATDYDRCAQLAEGAGGWRLILFGGMAELAHLLSFIPSAARLSHPRLLIAESYLDLKLGRIDKARSTFDLAAGMIPPDVSDWSQLDELQRDALNVGTLLTTYEDDAIDTGFYEECTSRLAQLDVADGLTKGVLECAAAVAALCLGRTDDAEQFARDAMSSMRSVNSLLGLNYCFLHAGLAATYRGDMRTASAYLGQARSMAAENFGADSGLKAVSDLLHCAVGHWQSGGSRIDAEEINAAFLHVREYDGWFEAYAAGLDTRFRMAWVAQDLSLMDEVIADASALARARSLTRLQAVADAQRLLRHVAAGDAGAARPLAQHLSDLFPTGVWQQRPETWRPYQDVAFALATHWIRTDLRRAQAVADDLLACAQAFGAKAYEIRARLIRAQVMRRSHGDDAAIPDLRRAVALAAELRIVEPFYEHADLKMLLRRLGRELWEPTGDPVEASFVAEVLSATESVEAGPVGRFALSAREQEVMQELVLGSTNKEIARALDMTENTVKFHLKNVFGKMGVDRRAHALALFRGERVN